MPRTYRWTLHLEEVSKCCPPIDLTAEGRCPKFYVEGFLSVSGALSAIYTPGLKGFKFRKETVRED